MLPKSKRQQLLQLAEDVPPGATKWNSANVIKREAALKKLYTKITSEFAADVPDVAEAQKQLTRALEGAESFDAATLSSTLTYPLMMWHVTPDALFQMLGVFLV